VVRCANGVISKTPNKTTATTGVVRRLLRRDLRLLADLAELQAKRRRER
jgi:hypothetical protein